MFVGYLPTGSYMPIDSSQFLLWVDALAEQDYILIPNFFASDQYQRILRFFDDQYNAAAFSKAAIGADDQRKVVSEIRGDYTFWLDRKRDVELQFFFDTAYEIKDLLNKYCYLSLSDFEFHLAAYPIGSFYKKHLDSFKHRSNRMITFLLYLNNHWQPGDGGELQLYDDDDQPSAVIQPIGNQAVMFRSDKVAHEVLPTRVVRRSLTGWFLYTPQGLGSLFG